MIQKALPGELFAILDMYDTRGDACIAHTLGCVPRRKSADPSVSMLYLLIGRQTFTAYDGEEVR